MQKFIKSRATLLRVLLCAHLQCAFAADVHLERRLKAERWVQHASGECPCKEKRLCRPIGGPALFPKEVYGFDGDSVVDYSRVTTVAWADAATMCTAHAAGKRAVVAAPEPPITGNVTARGRWVAKTVQDVQAAFMDGVVFDWESPCAVGSPEQRWYEIRIVSRRG
jgi:hypothetical protein